MKPLKGCSNLKKGRHSRVGFYYHLVFSTKCRIPYFLKLDYSRKFIQILKADGGSRVYEYTLLLRDA